MAIRDIQRTDVERTDIHQTNDRTRKQVSRGTIVRQPGTVKATLALVVLSSFALSVPYLAAAKDQHDRKKHSNQNAETSQDTQNIATAGLPATELTGDEAIAHALNRLGFGPRPGDIERAKQMGLAKWIEGQLHPESIDDSAVEARLQRFPTLSMSSEQLLTKFPRPQIAAKREGMTIEQYRQEQQNKLRAARQALNPDAQPVAPSDGQGSNPSASGDMSTVPDSAGKEAAAMPDNTPQTGSSGGEAVMNFARQTPQRIVAELSMAKIDRAIYSERQLDEQMVNFWFNHFNIFAGKGQDRWLLTSYERDAIRPNAMGKFRDLLAATAKSPAMLFFLDNWQSVDPEAFARVQQQQTARRAMAVGSFAGRSGGPADGPVGGPASMPQGIAGNQQKKQARGLNENYGRELMELHTLGVDGGYTQQDVVEVAKCFTGWTIRTPGRDPQFWFDERFHDPNPKTVLGHEIKAGGIRDGEEVLDLLARDPHTAHHLSFEIAQYFVSDNPPAALVERMSQTYLQTGGDIRSVLHTMIYSPEFWSRDAYRAKIKTPFELVVSAARAVSADVETPLQLVQWTGRIGEPLYQCQPPTGYSDTADAWVNTGALLNRLNYSLTLTGNRFRGVSVDTAALFGNGGARGTNPAPDALHDTLNDALPHSLPDASSNASAGTARQRLDRAIAVLLSGEVSQETRKTLETQIENPQTPPTTDGDTGMQIPLAPGVAATRQSALTDDPTNGPTNALIAGLVLGSPEFQRR